MRFHLPDMSHFAPGSLLAPILPPRHFPRKQSLSVFLALMSEDAIMGAVGSTGAAAVRVKSTERMVKRVWNCILKVWGVRWLRVVDRRGGMKLKIAWLLVDDW